MKLNEALGVSWTKYQEIFYTVKSHAQINTVSEMFEIIETHKKWSRVEKNIAYYCLGYIRNGSTTTNSKK